MKPGMKPDNFQQIYEKGMKPGMKPRYETGLPEKKIPHIHFQPFIICFYIYGKIDLEKLITTNPIWDFLTEAFDLL